MDPFTIITLIASAVNAAVKVGPTVIKTVEDATPFAEAIYDMFTGTAVSKEQADAFEAKITELSNRLQKPLPAATGDDV